MKSLFLLASATTALAANKFVRKEFEVEYANSLSKRDIPAQDLDENITLAQMRSLYWLDLDIGTPPQPFRLQLDTGSSNVWVPASRVRVCGEQGGCPGGSFDSSASDTYQNIISDVFEIQYADGTGAFGDFFTDVVTVGESVIPDRVMSLGLARRLQDGNFVNDGQGLVGVGYQANMAGLEYLVTDDYAPPTLIQAMVINGDIDRESYSLYLNDQDNGKGVIIFGGVDSTKYIGELVALQTLPTDNGYSDYSAFNVALTGISVKDDTGTRLLTDSTFRTPALLDSGTTITYLPPGVLDAISQGFGVSSSQVPCSFANSNAALIYHFGGEGGPSISVPIASMLDPPNGYVFEDGVTEACYFNVDVESDGSATLGDSFMRSGYFVYDLENNVVAIAQVASNVTEEDITPIPSGTEIPGCTSTNTLIITETAAPTQLGPMETTTDIPGGDLVAGTPTFALGSAATAAATGSGSGSSQPEGDAAVSLRVGAWTLGLGAVAVMFAL